MVTVIGAVGLTGSWAASEAVERTQQRHAGQVMDQYADAVNLCLLLAVNFIAKRVTGNGLWR